MNQPIRTTSTLAVVSLVFGVLCWSVFPFVGSIIAVVCGHAARGEIRRAMGRSPSASEAMDGRERPPPGSIEGEGMAVAGMILGYAQLALIALAIVLVFGFLGGLAFFGPWYH